MLGSGRGQDALEWRGVEYIFRGRVYDGNGGPEAQGGREAEMVFICPRRHPPLPPLLYACDAPAENVMGRKAIGQNASGRNVRPTPKIPVRLEIAELRGGWV